MNSFTIGSGFGLYGYLPVVIKFSKKKYLNNKYKKKIFKLSNPFLKKISKYKDPIIKIIHDYITGTLKKYNTNYNYEKNFILIWK